MTPKPCPWSGSLPCLSCCSAGWGVKTAKGGAWGQPPESGFQHKLGSPEVPLKPKGGGPCPVSTATLGGHEVAWAAHLGRKWLG